MKVCERYFAQNKVLQVPVFPNDPEIVVILPVLNDWDIFATIDSLKKCSCQQGHAGVIIVVNHGENCEPAVKQQNRKLYEEIRQYVGGNFSKEDRICFEVRAAFDLPVKFAGVGLARKLAMDAAAAFFYQKDKMACPILSLDADTLVEENYLDTTLLFFKENAVEGVSVAYAHRLEDCEGEIREAIMRYELYLRYYQLALQYIEHPHAFHCIGSAFAVRASAYVAHGGMNKRQAGEDFYFLQKIIATGRYALLNKTCVHPSARFSTRTPFGTGQTVKQIVENKGFYPVYHWDAFSDLKSFFAGFPDLYKSNKVDIEAFFSRQALAVRCFLTQIGGVALVEEANANSASLKQFSRRLFDHFNAFRVLKYLNYVHDEFYQKIDILQAVKISFEELGFPYSGEVSTDLEFFRNLDAKGFVAFPH